MCILKRNYREIISYTVSLRKSDKTALSVFNALLN